MNKKLLIIFYSIFCLGFLLKFFHVHFNAVIMLIGLVGSLLVSLILLFSKDKRHVAFLHIAICSWLWVLFSSVKFLPSQSTGLIIASITTLLALFNIIRRKEYKNLIPITLTAALSLLFFKMPTDIRYHTLNIRWNYEIESDFITLDKYSWFLYLNGKKEEARKVSDHALEIAVATDNEKWIKFIEKHNVLIRNDNWKSYR